MVQSPCTIGGPAPGDGNLISGNSGSGVILSNDATETLQRNFIGTDVTGLLNVFNGLDGINVSGSTGTVIGGFNGLNFDGSIQFLAGNLISGNLNDGINLFQDSSDAAQILGNLIGTNITGTAAIGNGNNGIQADVSTAIIQIGSPNPGEGNVISGNLNEGIRSGASNDVIQGN